MFKGKEKKEDQKKRLIDRIENDMGIAKSKRGGHSYMEI